MAPESERPKPFEQLAELLKEAGAVPVLELGGFKIVLDNSLPENEIRLRSGGQAARLVNLALEPTLTCSEVVERLAATMCELCRAGDAIEKQEDFGWFHDAGHYGFTNKCHASELRKQAPAILHSWREQSIKEKS